MSKLKEFLSQYAIEEKIILDFDIEGRSDSSSGDSK